jgi:lipoyl(octanoyl) transferase
MEVRDLGLREYVEVWDLQKRLVEKRVRGELADTVLLCEHPPVYTIGRSSKAPVPPALPHPIHVVERGGDLTYHGPGQLVGYPILDLAELGLGPRSYLRALEEALARAVRALGLEAGPLPAFTGLWARGKKIASIGVAVSGGVSYHGFALNVCCDLSPFRAIHPCNLEPEQIGAVSGLLERPIPVAEASAAVAAALGEGLFAPAVAV